MLAFLWFLAVVGALIGLSAAGTLSMRIRWVGFLLVLALMALLHMKWQHGPLRVALNLLLFFERHSTLITVLLGLSLIGFLFAWHGQLTRRGVVGGVLIGAAVALLVVMEWYCVLLLLLTLSMVSLLWTGRRWLGPLPWVCAVMTVYLATGLFISHKFYGGDTADFIWVGIAMGLSFTGMLWALSTRMALLASLCGLIVVMLGADLMLLNLEKDVPPLIDMVGDYVIAVLCLASIIAVGIWVVRAPRFQPLGWVSALMLVFFGGGLFLSSMLYGRPEDFADIEDQFKYGSIGSDHFLARGIPYFLWQALPQIFPPEEILTTIILPAEGVDKEEYRPRFGTADGTRGVSYQAFGLLQEEEKRVRLVNPGKIGIIQSAINRLKGRDEDEIIENVIDRPIGFSKRTVFGLDFVGINCAFCHTSTIRKDAQSKSQVVLGMPANTVDIELFFLFLFGAAEQKDFSFFSSGRIMDHILRNHENLKLGKQVKDCGVGGICQEIKNARDRLLYRWLLIPLTGKYVRGMKKDFFFIDPTQPDHVPRFGPGRVDAWSPGKTTLIKPPLPVLYPGGIIDTASIWNQKARDGMRFHWDGNTDDLNERNIIAGLVVNGPQIECLDVKRVLRITDWAKGHPAPRFDDFQPMPTYGVQNGDTTFDDRREQGRLIFQHWCAACHAQGGERVGRVEPLDARQLDTDPARMKAFTAELQNALNTMERYADDESEAWKLRRFRMQDGYVNILLDGIWLRAPYLHNGSVPTLWDLLNRPCDDDGKRHCRPQTFYRGQDIYDWKNLGFTPRIEPGDTLDIVVEGKEMGKVIPVNEEGRVSNSGIKGLDGEVRGRTADEVALEIDRQQNVTNSKIKNVLKKDQVPLDKIIVFLQDEEHLSLAEVDQIVRSVQQKFPDEKNKTQLSELLLREGFDWKPLVTVQIHKKRGFVFDTRLAGNHNRGHLYGTDLSDPEKENLLEFLKTL